MGEEAAQAERVKTGVSGLDNMLFGGIPRNNQVLVSGGPGTGKTLLSLEILYHNAKEGIPSAFITIEENPNDVIRNFKNAFPTYADIDELIAKGTLVVTGQGGAVRFQETSSLQAYTEFGNTVAEIERLVSAHNLQCIAIDSASLLMMNLGDVVNYRRLMVSLVADLRRLELTSILTLEATSLERSELKFTSEFFIFDGIIVLYAQGSQDRRQPTIEVLKMRGTNHSLSLSPYEITAKGFRVFTVEG